jgi:hypothetical protein
VTGTEFNAGTGRFTQRQLNPGGNNSIASYHNGHIVKRSAGVENSLEQLGRNTGIDSNPGLYKFSQCHPTLNNYNCAGTGGGQLCYCGYYLFYRPGQLLRRARPEAGLAYTYKSSANLRLKRRYGNNQNCYQKTLVKVFKTLETKLLDHQSQYEYAGKKNEDDPPEQPFAACAFKEIHRPVDNKADKKQLNSNNPPIISPHPVEIIDERFHESNPN